MLSYKELILESCRGISDSSNKVQINNKALNNFNLEIPSIPTLGLFEELEFSNLTEKLNFIFCFGIMNFCFWSIDTSKSLNSKSFIDSLYSGLKKGSLSLEFNKLANIDPDAFQKIFPDSSYNLMSERFIYLKSSAITMNLKGYSSLLDILEEVNFETNAFMTNLLMLFPHFTDFTLYKGERVFFLKKLQVLVSYLSSVSELKDQIKGLDQLTAMADYRLPQTLRSLGILVYTNDLEQLIDNSIPILKDSEEEVEIRANTVVAIDKIKTSQNVSMIDLDRALWLYGRSGNIKQPHHRTLTTFY